MLIAKQVLIQQVEKKIHIESEFFKEKHINLNQNVCIQNNAMLW